MKKCFFLFLLFSGCLQTSTAQNYIVDCYYGAPVTARLLTNDSIEISDDTNIILQNEEQVQVVGAYEDKISPVSDAIIIRDGRKYLVPAKFLVFSEENPATAVDRYAEVDFCPNQMLDPDTLAPWDPHSEFGKMLYSGKIPGMATLLLLISSILIALNFLLHSKILRSISLLGILLLLAGAIGLELYYFRYLGDDIAWWMDPDYFPAGTCFLRSLLVSVVIALQLTSIFFFIKIIPNGENLSFKYLIWMVVLLIPVCIAVMIILGIMENNHSLPAGFTLQGITQTIIISILAGCIGYSLYRNIKAIGVLAGVFFTLFFLLYIIGCFISLVAIGYIIAKIIMAALLQIVCIVALFGGSKALPGGGGGSSSSGGGYEQVVNPNYGSGGDTRRYIYKQKGETHNTGI